MNQALPDERTERLRHVLMAWRQDLQHQIDALLAQQREEQTQLREESVADVEDLSLRDSTGHQQLSILEGRNRTRLQLDAALQRLDEDTYGLCEDCLQPINAKRLDAVPFAVRCIECQRRAEQLEAIEKKEDREDL